MKGLPERVKSTLGYPAIEYDLTWRRGDGFEFAVVDGYAVCIDDGGMVYTQLFNGRRFSGIAVQHPGLLNAFAMLAWEVIA